jgi:nucleoside-diphosphate-sugar epimerase
VGGAGKVLVLGASGFFGGWIRRSLESLGSAVIAASRDQGGHLLDSSALADLVAESAPSTVVNAAGVTSPAAARADPALAFGTNTTGVANLLEAVRKNAPGAHVVALSSAAVYAGEPPFTEDAATGADTPYAASKLAMEAICGQYARWAGLRVTVLRCFNLIGPGEPATQASSEFTLAALGAGPGGRTRVRVGNPATSRDFTDVRDAADAVARVVEAAPAGTFNLCSGNSYSLADLARIIGELSGTDLTLVGADDGRPTSGLIAVSGDNSRLRRVTGWTPERELRTSLRDLLEWRRSGGSAR